MDVKLISATGRMLVLRPQIIYQPSIVKTIPEKPNTIVWKKFNGKILSSLTSVGKNLTHKIFSSMNN